MNIVALLAGLAVASTHLASASGWMWDALFTKLSACNVVLSVLAVTTAILFGLVYLWVDLSRQQVRLGAFIAIFSLGIWLASILLAYLPEDFLSVLQAWIGLFAIGAISFYISCEMRFPSFARLCVAACLASVFFVSVVPLRAALTPVPHTHVFGLNWLPKNIATLPTIVVLFDEFAPEYSDSLARRLKNLRPHTTRLILPAAGLNTINAVPALLTGLNFAEARPCGQATLCGSSGALQFRKNLSARPNSDVIGFYLPYCSIPSLRHCVQLDSNLSFFGAMYSFFCARLGRQLGCQILRERMREKSAGGVPVQFYPSTWRSRFSFELAQVPFWASGGLLYLHLPLPHPPAELPSGNLKTDYEMNVVQVEAITDQLLALAQNRFGTNFNLLVVSDHSLRVTMHCNYPLYSSAECGRGLPINRGVIPLIVSTPVEFEGPFPDSAVGLLK